MRRTSLITFALLPIALVLLTTVAGCGPQPPVDYQQLQIQDSEESRGYDVYLYVAVKPNTPDDEIEALLKWFDTARYPQVNKMKVFVWDNPQAALISSAGNLVGTLNVDRSHGIYELNVGNPRR